MEARFLRWAKGRMGRFSLPEPPAPVPVPPIPSAGAPAATDSAETQNYSEMEHTQIRSACSLTCAQYDQVGLVPNVYVKILTEGRTTSKVAKVLQDALKPSEEEDTPVDIFVSTELAKDVKELNFGYGNDKSFETCHRGISPFGVSAVTQETASFRRRLAERAKQATTLSMEDVATLESAPGPCPSTYDGLLRLLLAYQKLLRKVCGTLCGHYLEVRQIRRVLAINNAMYERVSPSQVAQVLWGIFLDARQFFSSTANGDDLPKSNLHFMRSWLESGSVKESIGCPVEKLLGVAQQPDAGAGTMNSDSGLFQ